MTPRSVALLILDDLDVACSEAIEAEDDSGDLLSRLLNKSGAGDGVFDKNTPCAPLLGEALCGRL